MDTPQPDTSSEAAAQAGDNMPLPSKTRSEVVHDVIIFQFKLFADGIRDLLLSPISIVLGIVGVVISKQPGEPFYRLLRAGRASERWLDLFAAAYPPGEGQADDEKRRPGRDDLEATLRELEQSLRSEDYKQGSREGANRIRDTLKKFF